MADLSATLLACQNPDLNVRTQAEQALKTAEESNLAQFFHALATELTAEGRDVTVRQLAGLHLKNLISAKSDVLREERANRWMAIEAPARAAIKTLLLGAIVSPEVTARHTGAQATAEIAAVELPYTEWPEFLPSLMESVSSANTSDGVKVSSLECLGYTCELLAAHGREIAQDATNQMLTTIVDGVRTDRPNEIRLAAAIALRNSLLFTAKNMENENERNMIMQTICEATQSPDVGVRTAAYECIVQIAYQYYDKLESYMQTLFQLTFQTIKTDEEAVALQAIEFWSTLCEEEMELLDEMADAAERGEEPERRSAGYVAAALEHLIPLLTEQLTKQDEDADEGETWNISMASATCLNLVANTVEDKIVPIVMPYVQANIKNENWRLREAATMTFGSILEGPTAEVIGPYVNQSIPVLLEALSDQHTMVKDTSAWTLGRICDLHVRAIPTELFPSLVTGLMGILMTETPRVSSQACFVLHNLAAAFSEDEKDSGTNALSQYMPQLLHTLLQVTEREGWDECNLRVAAYEAVNVLIQHSAQDCKSILTQLLPVILQRLTDSFSMPVLTNEEKEAKEGLQGLLCGVVQVLCQKLDKEALVQHADTVMQNTLQVLQTRNATAHEEALLATGALVDKLEADFEKYLPHLQPFVINCLQNFEAYQVCAVAVGLVGDLCRAVEGRIQPYCDEIVTALLQSLQNATLHRSVKPPVLSCFGDIALAIGAHFEKYLQVTLMMLMQASQTQAPEDDEELIEYINNLREGILEAYTGIVQGLRDGNRVEALFPYVEAIFGFLEMLSNDENKDAGVVSKAIGLVGDLASSLGPRVRDYIQKPFVPTFFQEGRVAGDESITATCTWAESVVQQVLQTPAH